MELDRLRAVVDDRVTNGRRMVEHKYFWSVVMPTAAISPFHFNKQCECVKAVCENTQDTGVNWEFIIIENNSFGELRDKFLKFCLDLADKGYPLKVIYTNEPFGHNRFYNMGKDIGIGSHLVFMEADVEVKTKGWLKEAERWFDFFDKEHKEGRLDKPVGMLSFPSQNFHGYAKDPNDVMYRNDCSLNDEYHFYGLTSWCTLMPRYVVDDIGGFNEKFISWHQETSILCMLRQYTNYHQVIVNSARCDHEFPGMYLRSSALGDPKEKYGLTYYNFGYLYHWLINMGYAAGPVCRDCSDIGEMYCFGGVLPEDHKCKHDGAELNQINDLNYRCPKCDRVYQIAENDDSLVCINHPEHKNIVKGNLDNPALGHWLYDKKDMKFYKEFWLTQTNNGQSLAKGYRRNES